MLLSLDRSNERGTVPVPVRRRGYRAGMTNPSDPTPEHPGMSDENDEPAHPGTRRESEAEETDGQVSETGGLNAEPVSDGDVADDGGPVGPDANYNAGARNT